MRLAAAVLLLLVAAGCGGEDEPERELVPGGRVVIGVVSGDRLVSEGARVEANRINNAGGVGAALTVALAHGRVEQLLAADVRLLVLPCRTGLVEAARAADEARALAVAPCDDGVLDPRLRRVFTSGLSPRAQAEALAEHVDGRAQRVLEPTTRRAVRVANLLDLEPGGDAIVSPDAPARVEAPDVPEGTLFASYGFPDPGNRADEFYERFKAVFGRRPESIVAALGSDAVTVVAAAVEHAASVQPGLAAVALREGLEVRSVFGELEFPGETNRPRVEATIVRVEDGRLRVVP